VALTHELNTLGPEKDEFTLLERAIAKKFSFWHRDTGSSHTGGGRQQQPGDSYTCSNSDFTTTSSATAAAVDAYRSVSHSKASGSGGCGRSSSNQGTNKKQNTKKGTQQPPLSQSQLTPFPDVATLPSHSAASTTLQIDPLQELAGDMNYDGLGSAEVEDLWDGLGFNFDETEVSNNP
jgi:hypothetical protein